MQTDTITADPLLDLKAVQSAYKLNLHTIRIIVNDDTMPVIWLGKKRYLRQSDLEDYISKHTKGGSTVTPHEPIVKEPTKPVKHNPSQTMPTSKKELQKSDNTRKRAAILTPKPKNRADILEAEIKRRKREKALSAA